MKKLRFVSVILFFICFVVFINAEEQEEIDYLLFSPNSGSQFVNEERAGVQLDNLAEYFLTRNIASGQINIYGYTAVAANDVDPIGLSRDRALFVINELQKRGVQRNLFSDPVGYGEVDLWGSNADEEGKVPNRRVRVMLNGNILTLQPSTGQVIESEVSPPAAPEAAEPEIKIASVDKDEVAIKSKDTTGESEFKFPWWILFLLLILLLVPVVFSKLRKKPSEKTEKPRKVESPAAAPAVVSKKTEPPTAVVVTSESVVYLEEEIRQRAYEYYMMRNGENGSMDGDWYKALPEICAKYEAAGYQTYSDGCWWARKSFSSKI